MALKCKSLTKVTSANITLKSWQKVFLSFRSNGYYYTLVFRIFCEKYIQTAYNCVTLLP